MLVLLKCEKLKYRGVPCAMRNAAAPPPRPRRRPQRSHSHATRTCIHICTGLRQTGQSFIRAEQSLHAHW